MISDNAPEVVGDLYWEAAGCLEHGYLTGASACIMLIVTELAEIMELEGSSHAERLEALRDGTNAEEELYDSLLALERYDAEEGEAISYDGWSESQLRQMLHTFTEIVEEYYPASA